MPYLHINLSVQPSHMGPWVGTSPREGKARLCIFLSPPVNSGVFSTRGSEQPVCFVLLLCIWRVGKRHKQLEDVQIVAVHTASIWPWFSVNELFYIFVILYKREKCLFKKKRQSGYIGYVCILVIPLSLGTDISSNKSDFSTNTHKQKHDLRHFYLSENFLFLFTN